MGSQGAEVSLALLFQSLDLAIVLQKAKQGSDLLIRGQGGVIGKGENLGHSQRILATLQQGINLVLQQFVGLLGLGRLLLSRVALGLLFTQGGQLLTNLVRQRGASNSGIQSHHISHLFH